MAEAVESLTPSGPYQSLKRLLPRPLLEQAKRLRSRMRLVPNFFYDARRFASASALGAAPRNETQYSALVTMAYHQLEKGLSLPQPRPFFGQKPLRKLFGLLDRYGDEYRDCEATLAAHDALNAYLDWHRRRDLSSPFLDEVSARVQTLPTKHQAPLGDGELPREVPQQLERDVRDRIFAGRRSIRDFAPDDVPLELIEEAVQLALHSPSVCNRQGWRVRCLEDRETIDRALLYQNGNRGFGHTINRLLVVTSTLGSFVFAGERNQGWIDGGLFAMSLMMALHTLGLASCPLNWNNEAPVDRAFRRAFNIPDEEIVIMFIAVGHYRPGYAICNSPRVSVRHVLSFVPKS